MLLSDLQAFYKDQNIFITGGSGFLGKVLIEKLLRVTEVNTIYMLIRPKKEKSINERINDIFNDPLFNILLQKQPNAAKRLVPIPGDCVEPDLGISAQDRDLLARNVNIVVHTAATVRFTEPLNIALAINTRATLDLINLAKEMSQLRAFLHVSSAFANCQDTHIDEIYYTNRLNCNAKKVLQMIEGLSPKLVNEMTAVLLGDYPNSYTYTKVLAEQLVLDEGKDLPICIFRPGIVIASYEEPVSGWIDNLYGPTSILYGVSYGVLRVMYARIDANAGVVPVDYCANMMLACAWRTSKANCTRINSKEPPPIYNLVPDNSNKLKWIDYKRAVEEYGPRMPLSQMIWFPFLITTFSMLNYKLLRIIYHTIPGYLIDFLCLLTGRKRIMVKTYKKIHTNMDLVAYFVDRNWTFETSNTRNLWDSLSDEDQQLFPFDMRKIDWSKYFLNALGGMRRYLAKEEPTTIPAGLKLMNRLKILHRTVQFVICSGGMALLWSFFKLILF